MSNFEIYDSSNTRNLQRDRNWPVVYFLFNDEKMYIGETTNIGSRFMDHNRDKEKIELKNKLILSHSKSNKSMIFLFESDLINRAFADGTRTIINRKKQTNAIHLQHDFYKKDMALLELPLIWDSLVKKELFTKNYYEIENTELFKYSPWKEFNENQIEIIDKVVKHIENKENSFIYGGPGTGKTLIIIRIAMDYILANPNKNILIYTAKKGNHSTFKRVISKLDIFFRKSIIVIDNLNKLTIEKYSSILIDEGQRLRKSHNYSAPVYLKNNEFKDEIQWIESNDLTYSIFYDLNQSFNRNDMKLLDYINNNQYNLISQFRMRAGDQYIQFIEEFLQIKEETNNIFNFGDYDLDIFEKEIDLFNKVEQMNHKNGEFDNKSRMLSSLKKQKWITQNIFTNLNMAESIDYSDIETDFNFDGKKLVWNKEAYYADWLEKSDISEVGCVHTAQGRDFKYAGVLFADDISFDGENIIATNRTKSEYFILMTRGIYGHGVHIPDKMLRERFHHFINNRIKKL